MAIAKHYIKVSSCSSALILQCQKLLYTHTSFSFVASLLERVLQYSAVWLLKCFLSLYSPIKPSVDFIIRTDLHSLISRRVGLLSHNVQFFVWENRHCSMYVPCVCSCNLGCQQEIWTVWGQTNMSHSSQSLMPLHFTLQRWWLQQQPVLKTWGHFCQGKQQPAE